MGSQTVTCGTTSQQFDLHNPLATESHKEKIMEATLYAVYNRRLKKFLRIWEDPSGNDSYNEVEWVNLNEGVFLDAESVAEEQRDSLLEHPECEVVPVILTTPTIS